MTAYTDDDKARLRHAMIEQGFPNLTDQECADIFDAVAPSIAARALREAADELMWKWPGQTWQNADVERWLRARAEPDVEVGSNHGDAH